MRLSASKMALWKLCKWWAQPDVLWSDSGPKAPAALGLAMHDYSELKQGGKKPDLDAIAKNRCLTEEQRDTLPRLIESWEREVKIPTLALAEVSYAYNPLTGKGRQLGVSLNRKYKEAGLTDDEVPGTVDLAWMEQQPDGRWFLVLPDLKTGFQAHTASAQWNEQMLSCALFGIRANNADGAKILIHKIDADDVRTTHHIVDLNEADVIANDLRDEVIAFNESHVDPQPGGHCKAMWCPAAGSCPKAETSVTQLIPAERITREFHLAGPIASVEEATYRLGLLPMMQAAIAAYEKQLRAFADTEGFIPTADGPWGPIESTSSKLLPTPEALAIIEEILGPEGVQKATSLGISAASIERAVKAKGMKPIAKAVERIVDEIKKAGAVEVGTRTTYDVRKGRAA